MKCLKADIHYSHAFQLSYRQLFFHVGCYVAITYPTNYDIKKLFFIPIDNQLPHQRESERDNYLMDTCTVLHSG